MNLEEQNRALLISTQVCLNTVKKVLSAYYIRMSYNMSYVLIVRMGYGDATRKRILYRSINAAARGDTDRAW